MKSQHDDAKGGLGSLFRLFLGGKEGLEPPPAEPLSAAALRALPEEELYETLQERTVDLLLDNDPAVLSRLPEPVLLFARVNDFVIEFDDGGLLGYLSGSANKEAPVSLPEDLDRVGAADHGALLRRFLAETGVDLGNLRAFAARNEKQYLALLKRYDFEIWDDAMMELPSLRELLTAYARDNLEAFEGLQ